MNFEENQGKLKKFHYSSQNNQPYADDAVLTYSEENENDLMFKMKQDLISILSFFHDLDLFISFSKTKFIIFKNEDIKFDKFYIDDKEIQRVQFIKFLGLWIDENLSWKKHIIELKSKISTSISKSVHLTNRVKLMDFYYSEVQSKLMYCLPIWCNSCQADLQQLRQLQNDALKSIMLKNSQVSKHSFYNEKLLSFDHLCVYETLLTLFKIKFGWLQIGLTKIDDEFKVPSFMYKGTRELNKINKFQKLSKEKEFQKKIEKIYFIKRFIKCYVYKNNITFT